MNDCSTDIHYYYYSTVLYLYFEATGACLLQLQRHSYEAVIGRGVDVQEFQVLASCGPS